MQRIPIEHLGNIEERWPSSDHWPHVAHVTTAWMHNYPAYALIIPIGNFIPPSIPNAISVIYSMIAKWKELASEPFTLDFMQVINRTLLIWKWDDNQEAVYVQWNHWFPTGLQKYKCSSLLIDRSINKVIVLREELQTVPLSLTQLLRRLPWLSCDLLHWQTKCSLYVIKVTWWSPVVR